MTFLDMIELYNVKNGYELDDMEKLFQDITLDNRLDKQVLIGVLLDECGAMDCLYETTPTFKYFSDNFFKKYEWNIGKLVDTWEFEYDPLKNRNLEWTETTQIEQNLDTEEGNEENRTKTNTGTQANTGTVGSVYSENETKTISAMNSSNYEPDNKTDTSGNNTRTDNLLRTDNLSEGINATNDRTKSEDLTWDETDRHIESGTNNIPFQDLIEKERKQAQFNIYNWIAKKYSKELFLLVY